MYLFYLGVCYETGAGVPKDVAEAARLYKLAVDQGDVEAHSNLGSFVVSQYYSIMVFSAFFFDIFVRLMLSMRSWCIM